MLSTKASLNVASNASSVDRIALVSYSPKSTAWLSDAKPLSSITIDQRPNNAMRVQERVELERLSDWFDRSEALNTELDELNETFQALAEEQTISQHDARNDSRSQSDPTNRDSNAIEGSKQWLSESIAWRHIRMLTDRAKTLRNCWRT
ncbi:MAG: hypothetical protein SGI77_10005 [Pirellulaceae bacterium]|nr:hypothetical protein [Pirellulaceae bacterium]